MKDQILERAQRIWRSFLAFTPGQKAVTIAAILGLTIGGYLFSSWASRPSYAPLFTNLAASDASSIVDKLNSNKTPYKLGAGGTEILVPSKDVYALRLTMSSAGLPTSGSSGYSLLDKEGVTTSEFKQNIDFQRALEGELDKTIQSIDGVTAAAVHLAIPQDTVFNDGSSKTTAAVLLTINPGSSLAAGQVQSVVNLVAASVPKLDPANVSVSDSTGRVLSNGTDGGAAAASDAQTAQTAAMNKQLAASIQSLLDPIAGAGHAVVTVNAALNFDKSTIVSNSYSPVSGSPLVARSFDNESYAGSGASSTIGVLGATSPSPSTTTNLGGAGSGSGAYNHEQGIENPALNQVQSTTSTAPGAIKSLAVAVVVDKNGPAISQTDLQDLVSKAVGFNPGRGDTLSVKNIAFDNSAAAPASAAASKAAAAASASQKSAAMMSTIKTGLIVLAVIAVIIFAFIANKRRKKPEEDDDLDLFLAQLNNNPGALPPAPTDIIGPKSDAAANAAHHQRQLSDLAEENPDEVARLLRSWLNAKDG